MAPCFVIAEAGSNHNGSLDRAREMIDVAAEAGADGVKFQCFKAEKLYTRTAGTSDYLNDGRSIYDIIRAMELPEKWVPDLASHCQSRGVEFLCSPFDEEAVDYLTPYVPAFKIASYEMTHAPLVRYAANTKKPLIVSTGTASLGEVRQAVGWMRRAGNPQIILLQCTASYPAPLESLNLRALQTMREALNVWTGLSDHSLDPILAPAAAVSLGARVVEKHFTLDNHMDGPDHKFAVEPSGLGAMIRAIRDTEKALGHGRKELLPVERELHVFARRSIFAVKPIRPGEPLTRANVRILRCGKKGYGLSPADFDRILGKKAKQQIEEEAIIRLADLS